MSLPEGFGAETAAELAAGLYACCLEELIPQAQSLGVPVYLGLPDDAGSGFFKKFHGITMFRQQGNDLGERMHAAFRRFFKHHDTLALMGSDMPGLDAIRLRQALHALETHECVLGPAADGGYYLIGFTRSGLTDCFSNMTWSNARVLEHTLNRLHGVSTAFLPVARDMDTMNDLFAIIGQGLLTPPMREIVERLAPGLEKR